MNWFTKLALEEKDIGMKREFAEIEVNIENQAGSERVGIDDNGKEWRTKMKYDYGFIYDSKGEDGEGLDVYLGPNEDAENAYIVHQNDPETGEYDEDKCLLGFESAKQAKDVFLSHYDSPKFFGDMTTITFKDFKSSICDSDSTAKVNWKKKKKK